MSTVLKYVGLVPSLKLRQLIHGSYFCSGFQNATGGNFETISVPTSSIVMIYI